MDAIDSLNEFIENSELVKLAKLEATHRYYYDVACKSNNMDLQLEVSYQLSIAYNLLPDWRYRIVKYMERYDIAGPINWLPISNRPQRKSYVPVEDKHLKVCTTGDAAGKIDFHDYINYPLHNQ